MHHIYNKKSTLQRLLCCNVIGTIMQRYTQCCMGTGNNNNKLVLPELGTGQ